MGLGPFTEGYIQGAVIGDLIYDAAGFLGERHGRRLARRAADQLPSEGWHDDPAGRYEHRYWYGDEWTNHVATDGVADFDPLYACQTDDQLPPEGWHADPVERYEYRYWDGRAWTDYVSSPSPAQFDPI